MHADAHSKMCLYFQAQRSISSVFHQESSNCVFETESLAGAWGLQIKLN